MTIQILLERLRPQMNDNSPAIAPAATGACTAQELEQWMFASKAEKHTHHWLEHACDLAVTKPKLFSIMAELNHSMPLHIGEELLLGFTLFQGGLEHSQTTSMPKLILNNGKVQVLEHEKAVLELLAGLLNTETETFRLQIKADLVSGRDLGSAQVERLVQKLTLEIRNSVKNSDASPYTPNSESIRASELIQAVKGDGTVTLRAVRYLIENLLTLKRISHEPDTEVLPLVDACRGDAGDFSRDGNQAYFRIPLKDTLKFKTGKHLHFDTFIPGVARTFEYLSNKDTQEGDSHWAIELEGNWIPLNDINQVMDYVTSTAREHLKQFNNGEQVLESRLYPIQLYTLVALLENRPPPPLCISTCERKAQKVSLNMNSFEQAETLQKSKVEVAQRITREEKAVKEAERLASARELGLPDNTPRSAITLAVEGASPEITKSSSSWCHKIDDGDYQETYRAIQSKLEDTHQWRDMSSKFRKSEYIGQRTGFAVDNECWLRAGWFSLLNQLSSPLDSRMDVSTDSSTDNSADNGVEESKSETAMELTVEISSETKSEGFYTPQGAYAVSMGRFSMFNSPAFSPRAEELSRAECGFQNEVSSSSDGFKLDRIVTQTGTKPWVGNAPKNRNQLRSLLLPLLDDNEQNQGRSMFCYTSPLGMRSPERSVQPPISALIRDLLWVGENAVFGDFELVGIELVEKETSSNDCKHYEVHFRKKHGLDQGKLITLNLTESAPDFSKRYLTADQLMTNLEQLAENSDTPQDVMLSAHGLTRAPALAVAQQIQEFIKRNPDVSHGRVIIELRRMISAVKASRGGKCLSKREQIDVLYELAARLLTEGLGDY